MKIYSSILLVFLFVFSANAQGIEFFQGDLAAVKAKAKEENKIIFVDAYTTWCGPCKWMAKNTFPDTKVGEAFNANFISYKLDMEKGEGLAFAKDYNVRAYPSLVFINGNGQLVHKQVGALDAEKMLQLGEDAMNPEVRIGDMVNKYKNGERDPVFIRTYLQSGADAMLDVKEAADWYYYTQTDDQLTTAENMALMTKTISNPNHRGFKLMVDNKDKFQKLNPGIKLDQYISSTYERYIARAQRQGEKQYADATMLLSKSGYSGATGILAKLEVNALLRENTVDWRKATEKIDDYLNTHAKGDANMRNSMAWTYYERVEDKKLLKLALTWAKESVNTSPGYANTDTLAALLYKLGKKGPAIEAANKAIALAKESGADAGDTKKLLEKINQL